MRNIYLLKSALSFCVILATANSIPIKGTPRKFRQLRDTSFQSSISEHTDIGEIYVVPDIKSLDYEGQVWYMISKDNAEKDLEKFEKIAEGLKNDEDIESLLKPELKSLLVQVSEANDNNLDLFPALEQVVDVLSDWTEEDTGIIGKFMIKLTTWLMNGKKEYASYFLLNGAANWIQLRVDKYLASIQTSKAEALLEELNNFKNEILVARNTLDGTYQTYFEEMDLLYILSQDIDANLVEIQNKVRSLKELLEQNKVDVLKASQNAVDNIQAKIDASE